MYGGTNIIAVAVLLTIIDYTLAIQCYRCTVGQSNVRENSTQQLCLKFSESNDFVTDCPYSTMCMKKVYKYELLDGSIVETVTRNCADQRYTEQVYKNRTWQKVHHVEEPYEPGCTTLKESSGSTSTMYCHCRGALCNSAPKKETASYHTDAMAVIFVFNAMKYLRSMD